MSALIEALHRYNVGPEWTRAEVVDLVKELTDALQAAETDAQRVREDVLVMVEMLMEDPPQMTGHAAGCLQELIADLSNAAPSGSSGGSDV